MTITIIECIFKTDVYILGFMPNLNARLGHRYSVIASEGLADFERQQMKSRAALNHLRKVRALHDGYGEPRSLDDRQVNFNCMFVSTFYFLCIVVSALEKRIQNAAGYCQAGLCNDDEKFAS